jgi:hypothetical protein
MVDDGRLTMSIAHRPLSVYNGEMPTKKSIISDTSNNILVAEYEYIANAAVQANEDRARVASFYLVAVGSLVAALFSTQIFDITANFDTLSFLFSGLTVVQLARLRSAWYESMAALNQIKEYAISKDKDLEKAFRWRQKSMPPLFKPNSVSYQQTIEVALLSGLTLGAAVYFFMIGIQSNRIEYNWGFTFAASIVGFISQLYTYRRFLSRNFKDQ